MEDISNEAEVPTTFWAILAVLRVKRRQMTMGFEIMGLQQLWATLAYTVNPTVTP